MIAKWSLIFVSSKIRWVFSRPSFCRRTHEAAKRASDLEALENTVRVVATDLDREWKDDAFRFVAVLALRGSGFGNQETGFRVAPSSDAGTLLADEFFHRVGDLERVLLADAKDVDEHGRPAVEARLDVRFLEGVADGFLHRMIAFFR